jgi:hypothetical protein
MNAGSRRVSHETAHGACGHNAQRLELFMYKKMYNPFRSNEE